MADETKTDTSIKSLYSFGGLLFLVGTVLLGSYQTMAKLADVGKGQPVATPVAILVMEALKLLVSAKGLVDGIGVEAAIRALKEIQPKDYLMYGVPGFLYAFNNNLEIVALQFMDPATNRLLNNLKIPMTAIIFQSFMSKTISKQQWTALGLLVAGSCLASLSNGNASSGELFVTSFGVVVMLFYGAVSASASVFNEYIMKEGTGANQSIHLQNLLLYSWGMLLNGAAFLLFASNGSAAGAGFETSTQLFWWILFVLNGAFHGLVISAVIKYLSSIFKLFMSACAIFVAGFLQLVLGASSLPIGFVAAACMVSAALYLYNTPGLLFKESESASADTNDKPEELKGLTLEEPEEIESAETRQE